MIRRVRQFNLLLSVFALFSLPLVGCTGTAEPPVTQTCNSQTCPNGCCQGNFCSQGTANSACGLSGQTCTSCSSTEVCQAGACVSSATGCSSANCPGCCSGSTCDPYGVSNNSCGTSGQTCDNCTAKGGVCDASSKTCVTGAQPDCAGKCKGASNGAGGTCETNGCEGCCDGVQCLPGTLDAACGSAGAACGNCTTQGTTCDATTKVCKSCTPVCAGKCKGDSDECGSTCNTNQCNGCCNGTSCEVGTAHTLCGATGNACANCSASGSTCSSGTCVGGSCTPDCDEKCAGASDDCGSTCPTSDPSGCCSGTTWLPGTSNTACGSIALGTAKPDGSCWPCAGAWPTCDAATHTCVASTTPTECSGAADGTSCSNNTGQCQNGTCCKGCRAGGSSCPAGTSDDLSCGINGDQCVSCTGTDVCIGGACGPATGSCVGVADTTPCSGGVCIANGCCKGCYYSGSGGTLSCASTQPDDAKCGLAGESCDVCDQGDACDASGDCELDPDSKWEVTTEFVSIDDTGKKWDPWAIGLYIEPDPILFIDFSGSCTANAADYCTGSSSDTFLAGWYYTDSSTYTAKQIMDEPCVFLLDADDIFPCGVPTAHDTIGECKLTVTESDLKAGTLTILDCKNPDDGVDYVKSMGFRFKAK